MYSRSTFSIHFFLQLLNTDEPICPEGESACADGTCLPTTLFCDGHSDCFDHSDEGWCDPEHDPNAAPLCDYEKVQLNWSAKFL